MSGELVTIKIQIEIKDNFQEDLTSGYTIKTKLNDVYGTHLLWEGIKLENNRKGEIKIVTFTQRLNLADGLYSLDVGVSLVDTNKNTEFADRKLDCIYFKIINPHKIIGIVDLKPEIKIFTIERDILSR